LANPKLGDAPTTVNDFGAFLAQVQMLPDRENVPTTERLKEVLVELKLDHYLPGYTPLTLKGTVEKLLQFIVIECFGVEAYQTYLSGKKVPFYTSPLANPTGFDLYGNLAKECAALIETAQQSYNKMHPVAAAANAAIAAEESKAAEQVVMAYKAAEEKAVQMADGPAVMVHQAVEEKAVPLKDGHCCCIV
jgi:hypothetical protein